MATSGPLPTFANSSTEVTAEDWASEDLPSKRWTSFDGWDYNGMKERLQTALEGINRQFLIRHASAVILFDEKFTMSEPFSAGQYWICFEMVAEYGQLVIARVRLPRHPDTPATVTEEDEAYSIDCEVRTMRYLETKFSAVPTPSVFAYGGPGSEDALWAGAPYMLMNEYYGNTLQDIEPDMCNLPVSIQKHIIAQWTRVQAELATIVFPQIGSFSSFSKSGEPIIGKLASASTGELEDAGPFSRSVDYFTSLANAATKKTAIRLGAFVFFDIVTSTDLFGGAEPDGPFPLNHMDLGTQNILVDNDFNFIAIIDWEFAQSAPWQVNHYPMPFSLLRDVEGILGDPNHLAYKNVCRQDAARRMYRESFRDAERELEADNRPLSGSFATTLESPASRIYACFTHLGRLPEVDNDLTNEMVRLAFGFNPQEVEEYVREIKQKYRLEGYPE
ncbi:hypothetical protein F4777DRAFT_590914 [Nemania sp. FL0916]|nr:hypothetical protein F4777DRAFT_590914 [Nemania sp. FL0916]